MEKNTVKKLNAGQNLFEFLESFAIAVVVVVLIFTLLFRIFIVSGPSMLSTLESGDRIVVSNLFFTPKTGDIIVFSGQYNDGEVLVKRVIATPGQTVDISRDGQVILDGEVLQEPYLDEGTRTELRDTKLPYTVKKGELFVMGDNREVSLDSRSTRIGTADIRKVLGKALFRIFPNTGAIGDGK